MEKDREITWHNTGNIPEFEDCKTENELSNKLDKLMASISEEMGELVYQAGGKTYVVGLTLNIIELDDTQDEDDVLN